jgi:hypothetical protein
MPQSSCGQDPENSKLLLDSGMSFQHPADYLDPAFYTTISCNLIILSEMSGSSKRVEDTFSGSCILFVLRILQPGPNLVLHDLSLAISIQKDLLSDHRSAVLPRIGIPGREGPISIIGYDPMDLGILMDVDNQGTNDLVIPRNRSNYSLIERVPGSLVGLTGMLHIRLEQPLELPIEHLTIRIDIFDFLFILDTQ